jgi:adenylate kinase
VKKRIVLLGPPASGKGTQAEMIAARYKIPSASPGSMLREEATAGTRLGIDADRLTSRGQLVPDDTVNALVAQWLARHDSAFVFDGYPRSLGQADGLDQMLEERGTPLEVVFSFEANLTVLHARIQNRTVCTRCRRSFSIGMHISSMDEPCPACGAALVRRTDDTIETFGLRMREYADKTAPLISHYSKRGLLCAIDATLQPGEVFATVSAALEAS